MRNAGPKDASGVGTVLSCADCHGGKAHAILPVQRSPIACLCRQSGPDLWRSVTRSRCWGSTRAFTRTLAPRTPPAPQRYSAVPDATAVMRTACCRSATVNRPSPSTISSRPVASATRSRRRGSLAAPHAHAGPKDASGAAVVISCAACHGGNVHGMLPVRDSRSPVSVDHLDGTCGECHKDQMLELRKGVHSHAGPRAVDGSGTALSCAKCHGGNAHDMLPVGDSRSPAFLDNQVRMCGSCHEKYLASYQTTVHGKGLSESGSGLTVVAVCADCHGDHGIYYAADRRSMLHSSNVAKTCGECHRFVEERLEKSVHGRAHVAVKVANKGPTAAAQKWHRPASCSDCHKGHQLLDPELAPFRLQLANRCGNCHPDQSSRYGMSLHGQLTNLGHGPAAECADCHGAHDILPIGDPDSPLAAGAKSA